MIPEEIVIDKIETEEQITKLTKLSDSLCQLANTLENINNTLNSILKKLQEKKKNVLIE